MTTTYTAQDLARTLWASIGFDEDSAIPASVLLRECESSGLDIDVCQVCGEFDGEHKDGCEHGTCGICGEWYRACNCDPIYERWSDR